MGKLTLYYAELLTDEDAGKIMALLPPQSKKRIMDRGRGRSVRSTALLGELVRVRMMTDSGAPLDEIEYGASGKPRVPGRGDIAYSISHSGNIAVGALLLGADGGEVGVDVEYIDRVRGEKRISTVAKRCYTAAERERIEYSGDPVREFYLLWTQKEAFVKYTGEGLQRIFSGTDTERISVLHKTESCVIADAAGGEYALSLCLDKEESAPVAQIIKIF